jgi:hypothetical protein
LLNRRCFSSPWVDRTGRTGLFRAQGMRRIYAGSAMRR